MVFRKKRNHFFTYVRETAQSVGRNRLRSMASIISIIATLFILGLVLVITINVKQLTKNVESRLEMRIFLTANFTEEQRQTLEKDLKKNPLVSEINFETPDEASKNFSTSLGSYAGLMSEFTHGNNPLPASYIIKVKDPESMVTMKTFTDAYLSKGVEYVRFGDEYIDNLISFNNAINLASIVILVGVSIIAIVVIYNTIKVTIADRRKEIGIMKYVGATDSYIRIPFVMEGIYLGLAAAIIAALSLRIGYYFLLGYLGGNFMVPVGAYFASPVLVSEQLVLFFVVYGTVLGALGSAFAIRKFLEV